jgi:hypothetical protein
MEVLSMTFKLGLAFALISSLVGCSSGSPGAKGDSPAPQGVGGGVGIADGGKENGGAIGNGTVGGQPANAVEPAGSLDPALDGSWYAGRGGTSIAYDSETGQFGAPNGDGLMFVFRADGTYTKVAQSVVSNAGCSTGFMAFEEGTATTQSTQLLLHPTRGHLEYFGCTAGSETDKPIAVSDEALTWSIAPYSLDPSMSGLTLVRVSDGSSSEFRRVTS